MAISGLHSSNNVINCIFLFYFIGKDVRAQPKDAVLGISHPLIHQQAWFLFFSTYPAAGCNPFPSPDEKVQLASRFPQDIHQQLRTLASGGRSLANKHMRKVGVEHYVALMEYLRVVVCIPAALADHCRLVGTRHATFSLWKAPWSSSPYRCVPPRRRQQWSPDKGKEGKKVACCGALSDDSVIQASSRSAQSQKKWKQSSFFFYFFFCSLCEGDPARLISVPDLIRISPWNSAGAVGPLSLRQKEKSWFESKKGILKRWGASQQADWTLAGAAASSGKNNDRLLLNRKQVRGHTENKFISES